jgi:FemAB-related protein (PEP-CTERM system-associated)
VEVIVTELSGADERSWDQFVRACPAALPHHLLGWRSIIMRTYGFRPRYLVARKGPEIVGAMPLFEVPSRIEGYHLTTLPGGLCTVEEAAGGALVERAKELVIEQNAGFLAIRDARRCWQTELVTSDSQCSVCLNVSKGAEAFRKQIPYDVRRYIDRAPRAGVQIRSGPDQLPAFFEAFSAFLRSRGTPVFPSTLLTTLVDEFPENAVLLGAWLNGCMIGGALNFLLGDTVYNILSFSLDKYLAMRPNHMLYWRYVELADEQGCEWIDLGRSSVGSGQHRFKMRWAGDAQEAPVFQQFYLHRSRRRPFVADDTDEGSGRLVTRIWTRVPLRLTRTLGPMVRKQMPFV